MTYEYDIFVSYPRKGHVCEWVHTHFYPELDGWLQENAPDEAPSVFIDLKLDTGTTWDVELGRALMRSRLLVAVYSGITSDRSGACGSSRACSRARRLGFRTEERPRGLVFPVLYSNGVRQDLAGIEFRDLRKYNVQVASYRDTPQFPFLVREIQGFSSLLLNTLAEAPPWQDDWPIVKRPVDGKAQIVMPRI